VVSQNKGYGLMSSINTVVISGRIAAPPEYNQLDSGHTVVSFNIGVEHFNKKAGESRVVWIKCQAWDKIADYIQKYFEKGEKVVVQGELDARTFETNGQNVKTVFVTIAKIEKHWKKKEDTQGNGG
jgi:single-strand DNA-binding protein